jgi:Na+/H+ antiporter NhaA
MALAIIDDLGAILVIAVFYGGHLQWSYLVGSGLIYLLLLGCRYFQDQIRDPSGIIGFWPLVYHAPIRGGSQYCRSVVCFCHAH